MMRSDLMRSAAATMRAWPRLALLLACVVPVAALAVTEPDTGTEYPDTIGLDLGGETVTLRATGVGLREKTFLKIDVYTIVSYVVDDAQLGDRPARTLCTIDAPKRIRMDLRRGFSRDKLVDSLRESSRRTTDDLSPFAADMATFLAYFDRDAAGGRPHRLRVPARRGPDHLAQRRDQGHHREPGLHRGAVDGVVRREAGGRGHAERLVAEVDGEE